MSQALIIGGGIGGPVLAAALKRTPIEPVVYEAHQGPGDHLGAFLTLAPNGLAALRTVGMLDQVRDVAAFPTTNIEFVNGAGRRLGLLGGEKHLPPELRSVTINRGALQRTLADAAAEQGVRFAYGKRFVDYTETAEGITANFTDQSTASGTVLIGADGIHSTVRYTALPHAPKPSYTGLLGIGGYTTDPGVAPTPEATTRMVFGRRGFFGYQTSGTGQIFWFANLGHSELSPDDIASRSDHDWKAEALELFRDDFSDVNRIMEAADPTWFRPRGTYDLMSLPQWHCNRVGLVGDAAHAVSPSSGQGASLAIEGGLELARCLRDIPQVPLALSTYEQTRRKRVEKIAAEGRRRGSQKAGPSSPIALKVRDMMMRIVFGLISRFGSQAWMHDYRIDFERPVERV